MPNYTTNPFNAKKRTINCAEFMIRWKDVFDFQDLYYSMRDWFLEHEYVSASAGPEQVETLYLQRNSDFGREIWSKWRPQKIPNNNPYYKYHIDVDMHLLGIKEIDIIKEGKKIQVNKGEIEFKVYGILEYDYQNKFSEKGMSGKLHKLFREKLFRKDLYEEKRKELYTEVYMFQSFVKQWLQLKRFRPYEEKQLFTGPGGSQPSTLQQR